MRVAVWFSFYGLSSFNKTLPYSAQSPTLVKRIEYKGENDLLEEVERILAEPGTKKYGAGQSLFYQLPLFCDPNSVIPEWCWSMLEDYNSCKKFNIPLANNLDEASAWMLDCFNTIETEINNCSKHQRQKNG